MPSGVSCGFLKYFQENLRSLMLLTHYTFVEMDYSFHYSCFYHCLLLVTVITLTNSLIPCYALKKSGNSLDQIRPFFRTWLLRQTEDGITVISRNVVHTNPFSGPCPT